MSLPDLDPVIHAPVRLAVMASLVASPPETLIAFRRLREMLGVTDGNLGSHLTALESAGYVEIVKDFHQKRPRTRIAASPAGRRAYTAHVAALKAILESPALAPDPADTKGGA